MEFSSPNLNKNPDGSAGREDKDLSDLILRVANNDLLAMRSIYDITRSKLLSICLKNSRDREDAEELLHDVYLTIWKKAHMWEPDRSHPLSWLAVIARNRAISRYRLRRAQLTASLDVTEELVDPSRDSISELILREEQTIVLSRIDQLPAETRDAIYEVFYNGRSYVDVSKETGVSLPTVKSRVRRALADLRSDLAED